MLARPGRAPARTSSVPATIAGSTGCKRTSVSATTSIVFRKWSVRSTVPHRGAGRIAACRDRIELKASFLTDTRLQTSRRTGRPAGQWLDVEPSSITIAEGNTRDVACEAKRLPAAQSENKISDLLSVTETQRLRQDLVLPAGSTHLDSQSVLPGLQACDPKPAPIIAFPS